MIIFVIVFGFFVSLCAFAMFIASIALNGTGGSYILSLFFMRLDVPLVLMGVKRLSMLITFPSHCKTKQHMR